MKSYLFFKKSTSIFLLATLLFSLSFYTQEANAQVHGYNAGGNVSGGVSAGGVTGVLASCGVQFFAARKAAKLAAATGETTATNSMSAAITLATAAGAVPVSAVNLPPEIAKLEIATRTVDKEVELQSFKEVCLDVIARYAVLKVIDKITLMTVEWINSGFEGNPFYPENRPNFFEQIAKEEVLSFSNWFSMNPEDFPFGKIVTETILMSLQNTVQNNFRSSLQQVLAHQNQYANYENFQASFSVGGWAGYTALALPNNNVFGSYLMANNHLARQTAGTNITAAANFSKELQEAGGLINQRVCRLTETGDPADEYIGSNDPRYMGDYSIMSQNGLVSDIFDLLPPEVQSEFSGVTDPSAQREIYNYFVQRSRCAKWETVTPGRFIAEQTTQVLGSPLRNLELGDELNENLGLIMDALIAQLASKGLKAFTNATGNYSSNPNDPNYNALWAQTQNQDHGSSGNQPNISDVMAGSGGSSGGGTSNLGLVALQQNYVVLADEVIIKAENVIRDIRTLDYCVPGPNPNWYQNGYDNLMTAIDNNVSEFYGTAQEVQNYYSGMANQIAGVNVSNGQHFEGLAQFRLFMTHIFNKYSEAVLNRYSLSNPPPGVRPLAANLFNQISNYQSTIDFLQGRVSGIAGVMSQLEYIQSELLAITPVAEQQNPTNPQVQMLTSLLNQISSQGVLVNQAEYDQLVTQNTTYGGQLEMINQQIQTCIAQTSPSVYPVNNERTPYPFPSIQNNSNFGNIPSPSGNVFISDLNFGSGSGSINLSPYNGQNISVSSPGTGAFSTVLGIY